MAHEVTFIPGDGTGPEIVDATRRVLEATGVEFEWDVQQAGEDIYEEVGNPLPDETLDSIRRTGVGIKGPTTTPVGSGFRSVNVGLRKALDLYSCQRPCKAYEGVRTRYPETDFVVIRENTEGAYVGIEWEIDTPENEALQEFLRGQDTEIRSDIGISLKYISRFGTERIVESAFEYAKTNGRHKVTAAHKANIMKHSDGLFMRSPARWPSAIRRSSSRSGSSTTCACSSCHAPRVDVIVLENLYGDIVSDLVAGMIGGLGLTPGGNIGSDVRSSRPCTDRRRSQGHEQGEPDGAHAVGRDDAAPHRRARRGRPARGRDRRGDRLG